MAAITESQLENASRDANDLAAIVNGAANDPDVQTRTGPAVPTVAKMVAQIQSDEQEATAAAVAVGPFTELPVIFGTKVKAFKLVEDNTNGEHRAYAPFDTTNGHNYTARVVAKAAGRPNLTMFSGTGALFSANFDTEAGIATNYAVGGTASIKYLGNGWFECIATVAATATALANNFQLRLRVPPVNDPITATYAGDNASGVLIAGVSVVDNAAPTVNLLATPQINEAAWTKQGVTVATTIQTNPSLGAAVELNTAAVDSVVSGGQPIDLIETNTNDEHRIYRVVNFTNGKTYRLWAVVKANGRSKINLFNNAAGVAMNATFNLATGVVESGVGGEIVDRGNGEFLISVTKVATDTDANNAQVRMLDAGGVAPYLGNGASGIYVLSAGWDEDGFAVGKSDAAFLLSASWIKQGVTAQLSATKFQSLSQRVDALAGGASTTSLLTGKKWCAIGTSQTIGGAYTAPLAASTAMVLTNVGVSGTTFSNGGTNMSAGIYNQVANIPLDTQVVTVEGLINDHYFDVPLGTIANTTLGTFFGALYFIWKAIATRVPNAKIVFLMGTPGCGSGTNAAGRNSRSANNLGLFVRDYQDAMLKFCENESVLLSAIGKRAGINDTNGDRLLADGLHYNATGGALVAAYVNDDMQTMCRRGMLI